MIFLKGGLALLLCASNVFGFSLFKLSLDRTRVRRQDLEPCYVQQINCFAEIENELQTLAHTFVTGGQYNTGSEKQEQFCGEGGTVFMARQCIANIGACPDSFNMDRLNAVVNYMCSPSGREAMTNMDGEHCIPDKNLLGQIASCSRRAFANAGGDHCAEVAARLQCFHEINSERCPPHMVDFAQGFLVAESSISCPQ